MINPYLVLSGIGMMLVGVVPVFLWRRKTLVPWKDFGTGAGLWAVAIAAKILMDLTVTPALSSWLSGAYAALGVSILMGAYLGLRTGLFESGFAHILAVKTRLRKMDFQQAVAFGLGFGCAEAFLLGFISFVNIAVLISFPEIIHLIPPAQQAALLEQLSLPTIVVFAPIIERIFTILVHVFCMVLVIHGVREKKIKWFIASFLFKTAVDGMIPLLYLYFSRTDVYHIYLMEIFVVLMGLISLGGILLLKQRYGKYERKGRANRKKDAVLVSLAVLIVLLLSFAAASGQAASPLVKRGLNLEGFSGRYAILADGEQVGENRFFFSGKREYQGVMVSVIKEETVLLSPNYSINITGELFVSEGGVLKHYNMTTYKNDEVRSTIFEFGENSVNITTSENGISQMTSSPFRKDSFIMANNMISHWVLLLRSVKLSPGGKYVVHLFSPNLGSEFTRVLDVAGMEQVEISGYPHMALAVNLEGGSRLYLRPDGTLLKMKSGTVEVVIIEGQRDDFMGSIYG